MVEMAASASASLAAGSLAAIVPGAGSWRNEAFRVPPSSVNSVDMPPDSMARHMVDSPAPGSSTALRSLKTVIATRPMRTSLGRRWGNRVNEGLTGKRLQGGEPESCLRSSRSDFAPARRRRPPHSESPLWLLYTRASETRSNATGRKTGAAPNDTRQRVRITRRCARLLVESDAQTILGPPRHRRDPQ